MKTRYRIKKSTYTNRNGKKIGYTYKIQKRWLNIRWVDVTIPIAINKWDIEPKKIKFINPDEAKSVMDKLFINNRFVEHEGGKIETIYHKTNGFMYYHPHYGAFTELKQLKNLMLRF
jgi:hypothetical protein